MHQKRLEKKEKIRFKTEICFQILFRPRNLKKTKQIFFYFEEKKETKKKTFDEVMSFERTAISWISACGCTIEKGPFLSIVWVRSTCPNTWSTLTLLRGSVLSIKRPGIPRSTVFVIFLSFISSQLARSESLLTFLPVWILNFSNCH